LKAKKKRDADSKISPQDFFSLNASLTISPPQKEYTSLLAGLRTRIELKA
jgi:hypothetical protein